LARITRSQIYETHNFPEITGHHGTRIRKLCGKYGCSGVLGCVSAGLQLLVGDVRSSESVAKHKAPSRGYVSRDIDPGESLL